MTRFDTLPDARAMVLGLRDQPGAMHNASRFTVAQALEHCACSLDLSRTGFPEPRSWLVQSTIGRGAAAVLLARGVLKHDLSAGIPGVADPADFPLPLAVDRLVAAIDAYEAHTAPVSHFMYGMLPKADLARLHAMHIADHLDGLTW